MNRSLARQERSNKKSKRKRLSKSEHPRTAAKSSLKSESKSHSRLRRSLQSRRSRFGKESPLHSVMILIQSRRKIPKKRTKSRLSQSNLLIKSQSRRSHKIKKS